MNNRRLVVLCGAATAAAALATGLAAGFGGPGLGSLVPEARAEGNAEEACKEFQEYLKTNPDSQGLRNKIADLSLKHDQKVADVLMPLLRNPKYDDDVKIAVCQAVGKQGKKEVGGALLGFAQSKPVEEKPKLYAAAIEGVGDADAKGNYNDLIKIAKKYLDSNADISCAAFRAASLYVSHDTVEDMMKALESSDAALKANAVSKRAPHDAAKPVLMDILKKMTGQDYNEVKAWVKWWSENKKTWEPPVPGKDKPKDINASETYSDSVLGFEIKKPNKRWTFRKPDSGANIVMEALEEGQKAAWCEIIIQETKHMKSQTAEAVAKELRDIYEPKFRDIKPGADWEKPCSYGGAKGVEQVVNGMHKDFDAIHMHNVYLVKGGYTYRLECIYKSGKSASLETDIEEFLKSFRLIGN